MNTKKPAPHPIYLYYTLNCKLQTSFVLNAEFCGGYASLSGFSEVYVSSYVLCAVDNRIVCEHCAPVFMGLCSERGNTCQFIDEFVFCRDR